MANPLTVILLLCSCMATLTDNERKTMGYLITDKQGYKTPKNINNIPKFKVILLLHSSMATLRNAIYFRNLLFIERKIMLDL